MEINNTPIGRRTGIDWSKYELHTSSSPSLDSEVSVYNLKKPDTIQGRVMFIVGHGVTSVTGDYGNWIFSRDFHPSANEFVPNSYWVEKLVMASCQKPDSFDGDTAEAEIRALRNEYDDDLDDPLTEEELEWLDQLEDAVSDEIEYLNVAYRQNVGRFSDGDSVPTGKKLNVWLEVIFDAFEELCRRQIPRVQVIGNKILTKEDLEAMNQEEIKSRK